MIGYLALGVLLLAAFALIGQWFAHAEPARIVRGVKWTAGAALIAIALFLALTGRLAGAFAALTALIPVLLRWHALWVRIKSLGGPRPGNTSKVETAMLRMTLDHDSGSLDGEVRTGRFAGTSLSELDQPALAELLDQCRADDSQGAALLEAYLDRRFGPAWRAGRAAGGRARSGAGAFTRGAMTREEAWEILGVEPGAGEDEIRAAYHRLMMKLHPDQGGSTFLAAKINQARDVLLGG